MHGVDGDAEDDDGDGDNDVDDDGNEAKDDGSKADEMTVTMELLVWAKACGCVSFARASSRVARASRCTKPFVPSSLKLRSPVSLPRLLLWGVSSDATGWPTTPPAVFLWRATVEVRSVADSFHSPALTCSP